MANRVWVYFYGSNIDLNVLKKVGFESDEIHVAKLNGLDIQISPLANLVRSDGHCTYGILVKGTDEELVHLYGLYVQKELGANLPSRSGSLREGRWFIGSRALLNCRRNTDFTRNPRVSCPNSYTGTRVLVSRMVC